MTRTATRSDTATFTIEARPPFDFGQTLAFIAGFPATEGEQVIRDGTLIRAMRAGGTTVALHITAPAVRGGEAGVRVRVRGEGPVSEEVVAEVRERVGFFLGLDDDLGPLYELAADDPEFARVVERLHGYHQVKFPSPVELLCWAILSQRTPIGLARRAKRALTRACGGRIEADGTELWAFPELDRLLELSAERIEALIDHPRKARHLHGALRGWAELDETFLRTGPYEEVRDRLLELPGIGPWSAGFLMLRGLGRMERASADREMLKALVHWYGRPIGEQEFRDLATRYGDQQGYWAHYLRAA